MQRTLALLVIVSLASASRVPLHTLGDAYDTVDIHVDIDPYNPDTEPTQELDFLPHLTRLMAKQDGSVHALHRDSFRVRLPASEKAEVEEMVLTLEKNHKLFSDSFVVTQHHGKKVLQEGAENCYYLGHVHGREEDTLVMASTCGSGVDAVIMLGSDTILVEPVAERPAVAKVLGKRASPLLTHVVYRFSNADLSADPSIEVPLGCQYSTAHKDGLEAALADTGLEVRSTAGRELLQATHSVELLIVNDLQQVTVKGGAEAATLYAIDIANAVHGLYGRLVNTDISVTLSAIDNWVTEDDQIAAPGGVPVDESTDLGQYLAAFLSWKAANNAGVLAHDNAQLLTGWGLSGGVAGQGSLDAMCGSSSGAVCEDSSSVKLFTIETVAHEMGHNFGARHDGDGNACASSGFLMSASIFARDADESNLQWSSCSESAISAFVQSLTGDSNCLDNAPTRVVGSNDSPVCGDFLVTGDEECDSALSPTLCTSVCTFKPGVVCATGVCCTLDGQFKPAGTLCREDAHQCDVPDYCNGTSNACASDLYKPDGTACTESGAGSRCHSGACLGYDAQCRNAFAGAASGVGTWSRGTCNQLDCGILLCQWSEDGVCYDRPYEDDEGAQQKVQVIHHTPCGTNLTGYCASDDQCMPDPVIETCEEFDFCNADLEQGTCTSGNICRCAPGWQGNNCGEVVPCDTDCEAIFRLPCISGQSTVCGPCETGRAASISNDIASNTVCDLHTPHDERSLSANGEYFSSDVNYAFDADTSTVWTANVELNNPLQSWLHIRYAGAGPVRLYEIMSAPDNPSRDITSWQLLGSTSTVSDPANVPEESWRVIDMREGVSFSSRLEVKRFTAQWPGNFTHYRLLVLDEADSLGSRLVRFAEFRPFDNDEPLPDGWEDNPDRPAVGFEIQPCDVVPCANVNREECNGRTSTECGACLETRTPTLAFETTANSDCDFWKPHTSQTRVSAGHIASSSVNNAFDNNDDTVWTVEIDHLEDVLSNYLNIRYGAASPVRMYEMQAAADALGTDMSAWQLIASAETAVDSSTIGIDDWVVVDQRAGEAWTRGQIKRFTVSWPGQYQHYRLLPLDNHNNGTVEVRIAEIRLYDNNQPLPEEWAINPDRPDVGDRDACSVVDCTGADEQTDSSAASSSSSIVLIIVAVLCALLLFACIAFILVRRPEWFENMKDKLSSSGSQSNFRASNSTRYASGGAGISTPMRYNPNQSGLDVPAIDDHSVSASLSDSSAFSDQRDMPIVTMPTRELPPTPLPPPWQEFQDDVGNVYYHNSVSGVSQWERPV